MGTEEFTEFYQTNYATILSVAQQRLNNKELAEDLTADTFRLTWAHHQNGGQLNLAWTYKTLRNLIGDEYRRSVRRRNNQTKLEANLTAQQPSDGDDTTLIEQALSQLPEKDSEILRMKYWEDLTSMEIAQILGSSPGSIRLRIMRAKQKLKTYLEGSENK